MSRPDFLSPVMMSSELNASPSQTLPGYAFLNPNKSPMLVDQLRISVANFLQNPNPGVSPPNLPGFFNLMADSKIDIMMGGIPLTNGLVPVTSLFPLYLCDQDFGLATEGAYSTWNNDAGTTFQYAPFDYSTTLHFEKPLYVPYGTTFQIRIQRAANADFPAFVFSMHGRSLPDTFKRPDKIWVPWAAGFQAPLGDGFLHSYVCQDNEMPNPFPTPLYIRHLQGYGAATAYTLGDFTVQITTSSNKLLIRDPTPFKMLFPDDRLILPFSAKLDPQEFLRVGLENNGGFNQTTVGMVGFREIPTPFAPGE